MTDRDADAESRVIRLFPGWAGTVLWAWSGLVEYRESRLTEDLIAALQEWESEGDHESLTGIPTPPESEAAWSREGLRLAHELAAQLGSGFTVDMLRGPSAARVSSAEPPTNPGAAAAFESRRVAALAEQAVRHQRCAEMDPAERATSRYVPLKGRDLDG